MTAVVASAPAQAPSPTTKDPSAPAQSDKTPTGAQSDQEGKGGAEAKPQRTLDLSNPRATIRTFLVAIQDAGGDHPARIDDAVSCLDTSGLKGDDVSEAARALARRLHKVIDREGVKLADIPEVPDDPAGYIFHEIALEPDAGGQAEPLRAPAIELRPDSQTGHWLFSAHTLASIPALEEAVAAQTQAQKPVEPTVPAARRSPRATMATFLNAMNADPPDVDAALKCLDPTGRDPAAWPVRGKELAYALKNVMDKIEEVLLVNIPDDSDGEAYEWYAGDTGNIVIARVTDVSEFQADWSFKPQLGEWRFTPQTLTTLDALYVQYEKQEIVRELREAGVEEQLTFSLWLQRQMPEWTRSTVWGLQGWQWVALGALLPLGWIIKLGAATGVALLLRRWLRRRGVEIDREARRRVNRAGGAVATVLFWYLAIHYLRLPEALLAFLLHATKLALGVTTVWMGYRCVDIIGGHIAANRDVRLTRFDDVLIPLLGKILKVFIVLVVVLIVLDWLGYRPATVLGALGIGGVALAFAAQDTLGNFFGSITVLLDRPFGIGDWIVIGDVEGTVERVGFRSTRVRTFYNSVITIPNSKMVNTQVDNYGARTYRRVRIMLSITYSTPPEKIDAFCEGIRELIRLHPYTRKDYYHVYFNKFAGSSLDILLYAFFEVPDWGTELRERHRLFVDIVRLADRLGVEFAFPTQTVWLERAREAAAAEVRTPASPDRGDPEAMGHDEAARLFEETYGAVSVHRAPVVIERAPRSKRVRGQDSDDGNGDGNGDSM